MVKIKEPVRLRQRKTRTGLQSLYLDIYYEGQRTYEYLHMYLVPEVTREDKCKNQETLRMAEAVRAKRVIELRNETYGFHASTTRALPFFDYCDMLVDEHKGTGTEQTWKSCRIHLAEYEKNASITIGQITKGWLQGFREYLDNDAMCRTKGDRKCALADNSKWLYWSVIRAIFGRAAKDGIITRNPADDIKAFKVKEGTRMYLTIDEVQRLADTPCSVDIAKRAFLFSCLTGLRRSDVQRLTWGDVQQQGNFTRIIFRQKKTKFQEYLDITPQAVELMGTRGEDEALVFDGIRGSLVNRLNSIIREWVTSAGIHKDITFHCARHTFAVMMLDLGTDIYTVSKLLGHREVSTTQIYAKVLDKNKQAAVMNIPKIL